MTLKICVVPQIQRSHGLFANVIFLSHNFILTSCITSPTWFLIKKNLSSNLNNQFYSPHFLDQSPGRLIKVSAERSGANWKEGTLSRHLYYSEATNLYWFRFSSSFIVIDKVTKKQIFLLTNKVREWELGLVRGEGRGREGDRRQDLIRGNGRQDFIRGGRLKRNKTRLLPGKSIICQHKSNYLMKWYLVDRDLSNNQVKNLPPGVFNRTKYLLSL